MTDKACPNCGGVMVYQKLTPKFPDVKAHVCGNCGAIQADVPVSIDRLDKIMHEQAEEMNKNLPPDKQIKIEKKK